MHMYLAGDTFVPKFTPPIKGQFWDFALAAVAASTDESVWKFPKNSAVVMVIAANVQPPHGVIVHRLIHKDVDPFTHSIAVAVKDTVRQVTSLGSMEWPQFSYWTSESGNVPSPVGSRVCPGAHRVRLTLRSESFFDKMVKYIDIGVVVAAERFSLPVWEEAAEHIADCSVRIVTTRGGGGVDDLDMSLSAVEKGFAKSISTAINRMHSRDVFTQVGHMTPIQWLDSSLSVKGKKWDHEGCPMLWIKCHHSVRQFPGDRGGGKGKDKHKGKDKGKGKPNDRGGGKGKDKHKGKDKGKDKGNGKLNDRGGGEGKDKHKGKDKGKGKAKGQGKIHDRGGGK